MADKPLTWNQIKNWWPIFGAIISLTVYLVASFSDIRAKQTAIETKIDTLIASVNRSTDVFDKRVTSLEGRVGNHSLSINLLNFKVGIK